MPTKRTARRRVNGSGHGIGGGLRMQGKGYCECGCGERTRLARRTDPKKGWVKGEVVTTDEPDRLAAHIGRLLRSDEIVHHRNGDPSDDRLDNLELTTRSAHIEHHRADLNAGKR